jgi:endoglucanase
MVSAIVVAVLGLSVATSSATGTPIAPAVRVQGNQLVDQTGTPLGLRGVNVSGTEFACIQGGTPTHRGWSIYGGQPLDELRTFRAIADWHATVVRVPLNEDCWLGINGVAPEFGGKRYRAAIAREVDMIHQAGLVAILDLHWTSPGAWAAYGQQSMADADHSIEFWRSVAGKFRSDPSMIFDLFNEPFLYYIAAGGPDSWECWRSGCDMTTVLTSGQVGADGRVTGYSTAARWRSAGVQQLVDAVRSSGAHQPVIANGIGWANDLTQWLAHRPVDSLHQIIAGWHSYPLQGCGAAACWRSVIEPITRQVPLLVGETGDSSNGRQTYLPAFASWADQHAIGYLAWTWNPWQDASDVLIRDWSGTPTTGEGSWLRSHLRRSTMAAAAPLTADAAAVVSTGAGRTPLRIAGWILAALTLFVVAGRVLLRRRRRR